jgi:hypothetical protein
MDGWLCVRDGWRWVVVWMDGLVIDECLCVCDGDIWMGWKWMVV